ncbi:MAG: CrcB family protein [Phycisphaeraceae bacterium]|nr:CrcB family protein [Phycisphaeraceae bacterium]
MSVGTALGILLCGGLGAVLRYAVDLCCRGVTRGRSGPGTFIVNVTGSLLLGGLVGAAAVSAVDPAVARVLSTGFLGAYTTFSTWTNEALEMVERGDRRAALVHLLGGAAIGVAAAALGLPLGRAIATALNDA